MISDSIYFIFHSFVYYAPLFASTDGEAPKLKEYKEMNKLNFKVHFIL